MPYKNPEDKKRNTKEYYIKNKERILKREKEYRKNNLEHMKKKDRIKYIKRKEQISKQKKERWANDPEYRRKASERGKIYREKNKEKLRQYDVARQEIKNQQARERYAKNEEYRKRRVEKSRKYYIENIEELKGKRKQKYQRYYKKNGDKISITSMKKRLEIMIDMSKKQGDKCNGCKRKMPHILDYEIDHIIPRAKGGKDIQDNLQLLCPRCNNIKRHYSMEYLNKKVSLLQQNNLL